MKPFPRSLALLAFVASAHACAFEPYPVPDLADLPGVEVIDYSQPDYSQPQYDQPDYSQPQGQPMYRADECAGAVVGDRCYGAISPKALERQVTRCHGQIIAGRCVGAEF